jgi:trimeric autotransporter adhesin
MSRSFLSLPSIALLAICLIGCGGGSGSYGSGGVDGHGGGGGGGAYTYTVGGTVTGLNGVVVLQNNGADDLTVSADGAFAFSTALANGSAYNVSLRAQPAFPAQDCIITSGSGTASANVTNVVVECSSLASAELQADAGVRSATLSWTSPSGASSFNVFVSSARNCDIRNVASCPDGALLMNVSSPRTVGELRNAQAYFFRIETVYANGARGLSNEAGARPSALALNDGVEAIATAADGTVYLGGRFTEVGLTAGAAVPFDADTGRVAVPDFPMVDGFVFAAASDGAGGWYLGGLFDRVADVPVCNLAHILANGAIDPNFDLDIDDSVTALAVSGSTVFAGGEFTKIDGQMRHRLAAIDASGALLSWSPDVFDINPDPAAQTAVLALAVSSGTLYVGGSFTHVDSVARSRLAAFDADGTLLSWSPQVTTPLQIDPDVGIPPDPSAVGALAVSGSTVYVGGRFTRIGSETRKNLAAVEAGGDGALLMQWDPAAEGFVSALAVVGGTVYAGGSFTHIDGVPRDRLAAVDASGVLQPWNPRANDFVTELAVREGVVYAGGSFTQIGGTRRSRLAAIVANGDGTLLPWNPGASDLVSTLAVSGSTVYAGGHFTAIGVQPRKHLAAIDASGALLPWDPSANDRVLTLATAGAAVYAGGEFTKVGNELRGHLAAIEAAGDGALLPWSSSPDGSPSADAKVHALAISNGTVYAGGDFTEIKHALGRTTRNRLAAIGAVGALDEGALLPWAPSPDRPVLALAVSGSTIYVGGAFTKVGEESRGHLAAIEATGDGALLPWSSSPDKSPSADAEVLALAISNGTVYAGGDFTEIEDALGKETRSRLAAIGAVGAIDAGVLLPWKPIADDTVLALAVSGSTVYAGGFFTKIGDRTRSQLAAIDSNNILLPWDPAADHFVSALAVAGSTVHVGGSFTSLGDSLRFSLGAVSATDEGKVVP